MDKEPDAQKPEPFVRHGTKEQRIELDADEVLEAIAEGRDIDIEYAVIGGDLDIDQIRDRLQQDAAGIATAAGAVKLWYSQIGKASFLAASFARRASFEGSTFAESPSFDWATFQRGAWFGKAAFDHSASFEGTTFHGIARFSGASFTKWADFNGATFDVDASFAWASFGDCAYFPGAKVPRPLSFRDVRFHENTTRVGLHNDIWCPLVRWLSRGKVKPREKPVTDFSQFSTATIMDGSSNPYLKRYIDDEQWIRSWRETTWWRKVLFLVWELTCHCGRSVLLWVMWSLGIALSFGGLYSAHEAWFQQPLGRLSPWYFSVVTFTTLGFGDLTPKPECWQAQLWVMAEVVLGYVMLGGLISILANKLARRS